MRLPSSLRPVPQTLLLPNEPKIAPLNAAPRIKPMSQSLVRIAATGVAATGAAAIIGAATGAAVTTVAYGSSQ